MSIPYFEVPIRQGADETWTINWYGGGTFRAPIEAINAGYPTSIMVTGHGLPTASDTPVIISGVDGMTELNSKDTGIELVTRTDADWFEVPISTVNKEWAVGTGEITYYMPTDLSGATGRCQIRKRWHSSDFELELTTENGGLVFGSDDGAITFNLTNAQTAALTADRMVWDVEIVEGGSVVTPVAEGVLLLGREKTR